MMGNTQPKVTKVLVDADLILEIYAERRAFKEEVNKFFEMKEDLREVWVTNKCLTRVQSERDQKTVDNVIILTSNRIIQISKEEREQASKTSIIDFDSAEEVICAKYQGLDAIITFNPQNFDGADFKIISIQDQTISVQDQTISVQDQNRSLQDQNRSLQDQNRILLWVIFGIGIVALLSIVSIIYGKNLELKKLASENGELKKHESEFQVLLDKEHELQRLIKDLKLKKISKDEINNLCRNPRYYIQKIRDDSPDYKGKKESDFTPKGVFPDSDLKGKVIPAFTLRCGFKVKSGENSREGSDATINIGLSMDKDICRSTEKNPIIAIPFDPLDPFNHYCVNTTDR